MSQTLSKPEVVWLVWVLFFSLIVNGGNSLSHYSFLKRFFAVSFPLIFIFEAFSSWWERLFAFCMGKGFFLWVEIAFEVTGW